MNLVTKGVVEGFGVGEGGASLEILELSNSAAAGKVKLELWNDVMEKDYPEGTIYRTKRARANLTYLFAISVKSEGTQVGVVTVRTVIKGLCRRFERKRSLSRDILLCEISWSVQR